MNTTEYERFQKLNKVRYTFQIEDTPTWYTTHFDKLSKVYKLDEENTENRVYEGGITLIKGKDGASIYRRFQFLNKKTIIKLINN